jgi:hypothetical protein
VVNTRGGAEPKGVLVSGFLGLSFITTSPHFLLKKDNWSLVLKTKINMMPLPPELWLMIFDIVIEEGIIRLDHCDYIKFPYMQPFFSAKQHRNRFYDTSLRLRLVCRRFNAILGEPLYRICQLSIFPLATAVRALILDLETLPKLHFEPLLAEMASSKRLVCLDVTCSLSQTPDRPDISDFFRATARQALPHVQRLTLRLSTEPDSEYDSPFWTPLHDSFPVLVTLLIIEDYGRPGKSALLKVAREVVFERLEMLYFSREVRYAGCYFPRLRHASMPICTPDRLRALGSHSPYLESLLVRLNWIGSRIDVAVCPRLKLLGLPDNYMMFAPLGCDHPLEHIWLYSTTIYSNHGLIEQLPKKLPSVSRITVKLLLPSWRGCLERAEEYRRVNFESVGLITRPIKDGDTQIIIE